ncbi:SusC/RagA family TonB-linked outer membrane protein [Reichenbachiella sp. MALMAid0571]|uniref:SusC/RagA family TonB-linked outer membrane protein n=1 Tax=Reichenbachiella sp. MALMAid0571 TaxID=3143939 RepID=UPI0032DF2D73
MSKYAFYGVCLQVLLGAMVLASDVRAQRNSVNDIYLEIDLKNVSYAEAFRKIENSTDFRFNYNNFLLKKYKKITIPTKDKSLGDLLKEFSRESNLQFKRVNEVIHVVSKKKSAPPVTEVYGETIADVAIKGKVTDENGEGFPGANVLVKGTSNGVITDVEGNYSISAPEGSTLVFSFVGYLKQEVDITGRSVVDIVLQVDETELDEVIVTAQGIRRDRKSLGYAISHVSSTQLVAAGNPTNPIQSLYGKAAGVNIRQSVSGPTGGIDIKIRNAAGLESDAKTRPLFVVDGVPIHDQDSQLGGSGDFGSGINDLNAEDIESIDILKGAKASVLYGSEGANGVLLITTKSGRNIKGMQIDITHQSSIEKPKSYIEFQNKYGNGNSIYDVGDMVTANDGMDYPQANTGQWFNYGPEFNANEKRVWWDGVARPYVARPNNYEFMFSDGASRSTTISAAGGGEFGNARFAYTNYEYDGIIDNLNQHKDVLSFSGRFKFSKKFTVEYSSNLFNISTKNRPGSYMNFIVHGVSRGAPFEEFIADKGYLVNDPMDPNYGRRISWDAAGYPTGSYPLQQYANQFWSVDNNSLVDDKTHLITSISPRLQVTDYLTLTGQFSVDNTDIDYTTENNVTRVYPDLVGGYYSFKKTNNKVQEYKGFATFDKMLLNDRLDLQVMGGGIYKNVSSNDIWVATATRSGSPFQYPDWFHMNNLDQSDFPTNKDKLFNTGYGENVIYSALGVVTATFDNRYTLELNVRKDWSSTLPPGKNAYTYPGVAFTWDMTEALASKLPKLEFGKIRLSYADVGRDAPSRYFAYNSYNAGRVGGSDVPTVTVPSSLFDDQIGPERKRELEVGFELDYFEGKRLHVDASFYTNNIYDQIMTVPLAGTSGFSSIKLNAGNVKNSGYEVLIRATPVLTNSMRWNVTFTTANTFSKIVKLHDAIKEKIVSSYSGKVFVKAVEGERIGDIHGYAVKTDDNGNRIVSTDGASYVLDNKETTKIGNVFPDFIGGMSSDFSFKGFSVMVGLDYSFGSTMYSQTNQWLMAGGTGLASLKNRDEANGGLAYYSDSEGQNIAISHSAAQGPDGEPVYHDGIILPGVVDDGTGNYVKNTNIASVADYYGTFITWAGEALNAQDLSLKNDYIKVREFAISYKVPKVVVDKLRLRSVELGAFARNLFYLHRTVPNLDAESYIGTNQYYEASPFPSLRSYGVKIKMGI